jgi:pyridoxine/pyridoxamine 5'-phosphate oxidase
VRVEGRVTRLPRAESDAYWASRPLESRLAARASDQSQPIPDRDTLVTGLERERDLAAKGCVAWIFAFFFFFTRKKKQKKSRYRYYFRV